ncbi:aminoglycoside phosphotransferase family protein [soil metagenome]
MTAYDPELVGHLRDELREEAEPTILKTLDDACRLAREWNVQIDGWLPGGTCSLILTGLREGTEVVLRAPLLPWEQIASLPVMQAFSQHGGIPILASDPASGVALVPRLRPGTSLGEFEDTDDEAIDIFVGVALKLRGAQGQGRSVETYFVDLKDRVLPASLRPDLPADAARLAKRLFETVPPLKLLHGDLHHFNILKDGNEWIAIDPEGGAGDPAYEPSAFLRNPTGTLRDHPDLAGLTRRRIIRFAEGLGDPLERIWGWALVRTLLSASDVPNSSGETWTKVAGVLDELGNEFASPLIENWGKSS